MPTKRRVYASTKKSHQTCMLNFAQYRIAGMVENLHRIYHERTKKTDVAKAQIHLCIDELSKLRLLLKEHDDATN